MIRTRLSLLALAIASGCANDDDDDAGGDGGDTAAADETTNAADDAVDDAADDAVDDAADDSGSGDGAGDESSSGGVDIDALYDCVDPMIITARPLLGPGYDPEMGGLIDPQDTYVISSTQIYVRPEKQQEFFEQVTAVTAELDTSEGMVAYSLGLDSECGFARTISIFRTQESMVAFSGSMAHAQAVVRSNELGVTGKVGHWEISAAEFPPTWEAMSEQLETIEPFGEY